FSETELLSAELITLVLAECGLGRAAKAYVVDAEAVWYKWGVGFKFAARGLINSNAIFIDSTGCDYALASHTLPSARGQGEPLTGRLTPESGATFEGVLMADDGQQVLLASDAGYGFVAKVSELQSKNKSGKSVLKLPAGSKVLPPLMVSDYSAQLVVAISNEGRMLMFPLSELPELPRGKGNKIMSIPSARASERIEFLVALCVMGAGDTLIVHAGRRHLSLRLTDLEHYRGERGRRG